MASYNADCSDSDLSFSKKMENCLLNSCKQLSTPVPVWMKKNTHELSCFRQTIFTADQFMEKVNFDRFCLRIDEL